MLRTMRAVIYTRASLDRTGEGKSNARQREEALRLVEYKRWDLVTVDGEPSIDDISISAYGKKNRPGWNKVLSMIEAGEVDVVVAYHLDRLTRNMADLEKLILLCEQHSVSVATATGDIDLTNDTGRMVARILAAVARQEVERKAARQKLAHNQRRAEGKPWAGVKMLGYTNHGELIEEEANAIREAVQDVLAERASLAEIGRRWSACELRSPYQKIKDEAGNVIGWKHWTPRGVKNVLTNPRIAGLITVTLRNEKGAATGIEVVGEGDWEPIVDETDLAVLVAKLNSPERTNGSKKSGRLPSNLLTGIMRCAKCDGTVRAGSKRGVETYICGDWHTQVPRAEADRLVRFAFAGAVALGSPGAILEARSPEVDPEDAATEIAALRERQGVLARSFARGFTPETDYEAAVADIAQQINDLESKVESTASSVDWYGIRKESVLNFVGQDMMEQRRVLERTAIIKMHPVGHGRTGAQNQIEMWVKGRRAGREILIPAHKPKVLA